MDVKFHTHPPSQIVCINFGWCLITRLTRILSSTEEKKSSIWCFLVWIEYVSKLLCMAFFMLGNWMNYMKNIFKIWFTCLIRMLHIHLSVVLFWFYYWYYTYLRILITFWECRKGGRKGYGNHHQTFYFDCRRWIEFWNKHFSHKCRVRMFHFCRNFERCSRRMANLCAEKQIQCYVFNVERSLSISACVF